MGNSLDFEKKRDFIAVNGKRNENTLLNEHRNVTVKWLLSSGCNQPAIYTDNIKSPTLSKDSM